MKYCSQCGGEVELAIPPTDDRARFCCRTCGAVHYQNPRVVVGSVPEHRGRLLLCRRAIEPCYGKWTLPAGYLENGETLAACAEREALEEACARITDLAPYRIYNICHINQVYVMFRGRLAEAEFSPGRESLEVRLFEAGEIPWEEIAFRVIAETLRAYLRDRAGGAFAFAIDEIGPTPGFNAPRSEFSKK
jgi:ADP-ribose pyrophosphatase YjhB (NUDIX family)